MGAGSHDTELRSAEDDEFLLLAGLVLRVVRLELGDACVVHLTRGRPSTIALT